MIDCLCLHHRLSTSPACVSSALPYPPTKHPHTCLSTYNPACLTGMRRRARKLRCILLHFAYKLL